MRNSDEGGIKSLLGKALALLLFLGLAYAWAESVARRVPSSYAQKAGGLAAASGAEILVLGASEAFQGIAPAGLGRPAYSLANVGQSLYYDEALFQGALPALPDLKMLILGLSYPSLYFRMDRSPEAWRSSAYALNFKVPAEGAPGRWDIRDHSALFFYEPSKVLQWALTGRGMDLPSLDGGGFEALPCLAEERLDLSINELTARKRAAYHRSIMDAALEDENAAHVKAILDLAMQRHVVVALLFLPLTPDYAAALDPGLRDRARGRVRQLAHEGQALFRDYSTDPRFQEADFADVDHLCGAGALKFSALLDREVIEPAVRARSH